ncbi:hypothetical protein D3C77_07700 [compost metagenome]
MPAGQAELGTLDHDQVSQWQGDGGWRAAGDGQAIVSAHLQVQRQRRVECRLRVPGTGAVGFGEAEVWRLADQGGAAGWRWGLDEDILLGAQVAIFAVA